jgi:hypothetical protein
VVLAAAVGEQPAVQNFAQPMVDGMGFFNSRSSIMLSIFISFRVNPFRCTFDLFRGVSEKPNLRSPRCGAYDRGCTS